MLRFAHHIGCVRYVGAGSIMEDETIAANFAQENRPGEAYIYSDGKLAAHLMGKSVAAKLGIDFVWTKITNAYGPNEISPRFINTTLRKILTHEDLQFTSATQNYDFVYIDDVAEAFYRIGENGKPFGEYMIGSSDAKPLRSFIEEIVNTLAPDRKPLFGDIPFTGINLPLETFDTKITEAVTGFKAGTPFPTGIKNTMDWLKQRQGNDD
jgi:nucleoside-diphosphate-sugar epimerase